MDSLVETFHIDITLMLAQAVNFVIVLAVLYYFAIKPLTRKMNERKDEIEKGLEDAKVSKDSLLRAQEEYAKMIKDARVKASSIVEEAIEKGEQKKQQYIEDAKDDIEMTIVKEKNILKKEREMLMEEIKEKVADLISTATEKIVRNEIDVKNNEHILKETFEGLDVYEKTLSNK